jgi:hypothetical protein
MRIGNIFLFTGGLTSKERTLTGVNGLDDLELAIRQSAAAHRPVAIIPEGPYVLPFD